MRRKGHPAAPGLIPAPVMGIRPGELAVLYLLHPTWLFIKLLPDFLH